MEKSLVKASVSLSTAIVLASLIWVVGNRYQLVGVAPNILRIDKITGRVWVIRVEGVVPFKFKEVDDW